MKSATSICLSMIVKNEAHVIERCLASVKPLISHWVIVDTGSTDETIACVKRALDGVPGEIVSRPWKDFASNRTEALALAKDKADYVLVVDADDVLEIPPGIVIPVLRHGAYAIRVDYDGTSYYRLHLLRSALPWRFEGVVHEVPVCDEPYEQARIEGIVYRIVGGGARQRDPDRFVHDARLLEAELARDPSSTRTAFYLAQSYRDAGMNEEALTIYERRATMGGWDEEVFYSLLQAALIRERLGHPPEAVWSAFLRAHRARPQRVEALTELARYCRLAGDYSLGYVFAKTAAEAPRPVDALFVDDGVYAWRALDELAIAAFYIGRFDVSASSAARLLTEGRLPPGEVERVTRNFNLVATARASS